MKNTNTLLEKLKQLLADEKQTTPEYGELKRHFGWEFDGMRLHEFYFGNMLNANSPLDQGSSLRAQLAAQFGSYEMWEKDFRATAAMRGIGWAILRYERETGMLFNAWANEHDVGHLAGTKILLIMDVFEHAYITDYGIKRADYIEAFMKAVDWTRVEERFQSAS